MRLLCVLLSAWLVSGWQLPVHQSLGSCVTRRQNFAAMMCCASALGAGDARGEATPLPDCWDAHNHLQLSRQDPAVYELISNNKLIISLMGTQPADWIHIQALTGKFPAEIRPNYGLHPWWAHDHPPPTPGNGWMADLRNALESDPSSSLGEIGLDGQWVPPGLEEVQFGRQLDAFRQQLQLAVELRRPVSLHCVKAYGEMFDLLRTAPDLPPAVYMHSWGGKIGMLESYLKMKKYGDRFYFGFSSFANLRQNCHKTSSVIAAVPDHRLLLESDLEDPAHVPGALNSMLRVMAEAKGWSLEHTAAITKMNAQRFYESGRAHHETLPSTLPVTPKDEMHVNAVRNAVTQQGDKVRRMKDANKAKASTFSQSELDQVIALLKSLKSQLPPS